jgi:hypothetical protein
MQTKGKDDKSDDKVRTWKTRADALERSADVGVVDDIEILFPDSNELECVPLNESK